MTWQRYKKSPLRTRSRKKEGNIAYENWPVLGPTFHFRLTRPEANTSAAHRALPHKKIASLHRLFSYPTFIRIQKCDCKGGALRSWTVKTKCTITWKNPIACLSVSRSKRYYSHRYTPAPAERRAGAVGRWTQSLQACRSTRGKGGLPRPAADVFSSSGRRHRYSHRHRLHLPRLSSRSTMVVSYGGYNGCATPRVKETKGKRSES